uniref:NTR domain-containing protein n=1 Tax=Pygocentrus nattereri TaxID=42514 RepID=A0A3B4D1J4_PYGNA
MGLLLLLCVMHVLWVTEAQERTFLITAPKLWRVDATETVLVQLFGYDQETRVNLYVKNSLAKDAIIYASQTVNLNAQNYYQAAATLRIFHIPAEVPEVTLEAVSSTFHAHTEIPLSRVNGFLFIQTDKPLYTPEQNVEVRVYSLNEELRKSNRSVTLTFMDPDGIKVEMIELTDINGVKPLLPPFKIPLKPKFGVWKIEATFTKDFSTTATAEFEIKEYVLPSISVRIQPEANFVSSVNYEEFKLKILAKYISGAVVDSAEVFLKFGYIRNNAVVMIPSTIRRYTVKHLTILLTPSQKDIFADCYVLVRVLQVQSLPSLLSGGISQEAVLSNIKIVDAPFTLSLIATPAFIKPSLPYTIRVLVKDPLGEPMRGVPVKARGTLTNTNQEQEPLRFLGHLDEIKHTSQQDGVTYFICNIPSNAAKAEFTFETDDQRYPPDSQAHFQLKTVVYHSENQRYLYIDLPSDLSSFEVGDYANIKIHFSYRDYLPLKTFSYQIISKGKVVKFETVQRVSEKSQNINFKVTANMVPSARLLVYYILSGEQRSELVADSVWLDIKAKCVSLVSTNMYYKPKDTFQLSVMTKSDSQRSLVALSAVDMALYDLRANHKNPMTKVLRLIEHSDLGCGGGGGRNNIDVFYRTGLTFLTNANVKSSTADEACTAVVRPKRSTIHPKELLEELANQYGMYKLWCLAGTERIPILESCADRTKRLSTQDKRCKKVFYDCCNFARDVWTKAAEKIVLSRSEVEFLLNEKIVEVRSYFPESWLWEEYEIDRSGSLVLTKSLPDSLTTWEMKAVGVFNNGICLSDPVEVRVSQDLSIDVPLPYSMVRGEQIELKGSVYNKRNRDIRYSVTLSASDGVCVFHGTLWTQDGDPHVNKGRIGPQSVAMVRFYIMALEAGTHELTFTLSTMSTMDTVVKKLRVVPEGVRKEMWIGGRLDPQGVYGKDFLKGLFYFLRNSLPLNLVPKSTVDRVLTVNGEVLGELLSIITDPKGIMQLINLPRGSAEVELLGLLPVFYVYDYVEQTELWGQLGTAVSSTGLKRKINEGITSIMSFKLQREHSFSLWKNKEPSTWLTALVVRTLAQVDKYVTVDHDVLSNTIRWLITQCQNPDGSFSEKSSYKPKRLMGAGADVTEQTVYLTSFVVIGIKNALGVPKGLSLQIYQDALDRAVQYLSLHVLKLKSLYVRAIAAYAMTLIDLNSWHAVNLYEKLKKESEIKGSPAIVRFWQEKDVSQDPLKPNKATALTVETTVYVLLSTLLRGDITYAKPIVNWLTQDQRYGGGFFSTQDAILTLEAITKYRILAKKAFLQMEVDVSYRSKGPIGHISLSQSKPVGKPIEVAYTDDVILKTAYSSGVSFANLRTVYYETIQNDENCRFDLSIDVHPLTYSQIVRFLSHRFKPHENEVELEAGHTVMEINLPTGVSPVLEDLKKVRNSAQDGLESRISDYEINGNVLTLQMDSIPSDDLYCVGFRIQEVFQTGTNSASLFKVYEYHDPGKCSKFYYTQSRRLLRLCSGTQCHCMAAECCKFKASTDDKITTKQRKQDMCRDSIKYAFKVKITSTTAEGDFLTYNAKVEQTLKKGSEDIKKDSEISFVKKATCSSTNLEIEKQYLIMGAEIMQLRVNRSYKYKFPLDSQASVEWWPTDSDCLDSRCRDYANDLNDFEFDFTFEGCNGT